jgi:hypothetical protein
MFRRTDEPGKTFAEKSGDELVLREKDGNVSSAPSTTGAASYLLGKIDSLLPATSSGHPTTDTDEIDPAATGTHPAAQPQVAQPRLSEKPPWGNVNPDQAPRWSANRTPSIEPHESRRNVPPTVEPKRRTHKIVDGDTLSLLAARYLGNADRHLEIFEANKAVLPGPDILPIGIELEIPPKIQPQPTPAPQDVSRQPVSPPTKALSVNRSQSADGRDAGASAPKESAGAGPTGPAATIADPPIKRLVPVPPTTNDVGPSS